MVVVVVVVTLLGSAHSSAEKMDRGDCCDDEWQIVRLVEHRRSPETLPSIVFVAAFHPAVYTSDY